jgi:Protein of unknown function (DUF3631)
MNAITRHFGEPQRRRLRALFTTLGSDNAVEADFARASIINFLRDFDKGWVDIVELLGGDPSILHADLAADIIALGDADPDVRSHARENIFGLLLRHRKTFAAFVDALCSGSREPWMCNPPGADPEPYVNPLDFVRNILEQYADLQPHEYVAVSLWALHTHVYTRFMLTPRLTLLSPTADSGKTTILDILTYLVARPKKYDSITVAALVRLIDRTHSTVLLDEVDNLDVAGRMLSALNSGHRRGGNHGLTEGGEERDFSTHAPLALGILGMNIHRSLDSRSITIKMKRSPRKLPRFDTFKLELAYQQILRWARDVVLDDDPVMPVERNRYADNWRVLIAIADTLGWGDEAREAMMVFLRERHDVDCKINLLIDCRKAFGKLDRILGKTLLAALHAMDDAEWTEFRGVRGDQQPHKMRDTELAVMLRDFEIRPRSIWPARRTATSKSAKGYRRAQFEDAWSRYCPEDGTAEQPSNIRSLRLAGDGTV